VTKSELLARLREAGILVPPSGVLSAAQTAEVLGRSTVTLERWRAENSGPRAVRLNGRYHYDVEEIAAYLSGDEPRKAPQKPSQPLTRAVEPDVVAGETSRVRKPRSLIR
jgi:hypothetical protein